MRKLFKLISIILLLLSAIIPVQAITHYPSVDSNSYHFHMLSFRPGNGSDSFFPINLSSDIQTCGCTPIAIAGTGANTMGDTTMWVMCQGGSGGGGNSGPPSLSSVTVDEYEDIMRRLLGDVTVKIEDLEGQVGQAVLDALNQV